MLRRDRVAVVVGVTFVCAWLGVWLAADAQPSPKVARIAIVWPGPRSQVPPALPDALRQGLRAAGWIDGGNVHIDQHYIERENRLGDVLAGILRAEPAVLVTPGTPLTLAVHRAAPGVPIVMVAGADPVATGLVTNLAHPGGSVTGLTGFAADLGPKSLELIRELLPRASRVAALWNSANPGAALWLTEARSGAGRFGLILHAVEFRAEPDLDAAFQAIQRLRPDALAVGPDPIAIGYRERIVEFAARLRLPAIYPYREFLTAGGLIAYTNDLRDLFRRAASYIDKILRGTPPGDLPIQQPTKFELVINLKAAKAIGLTIPDSLLVRADQVIE